MLVNGVKTIHYGRRNVIYVKARYSDDNSLGQAAPGTANLANEFIGRCQGYSKYIKVFTK